MLTCTGLHNPDRARTHLLIILALRKERLAEHKFKIILYLKNGDLSRFLETLFHSTYIHTYIIEHVNCIYYVSKMKIIFYVSHRNIFRKGSKAGSFFPLEIKEGSNLQSKSIVQLKTSICRGT